MEDLIYLVNKWAAKIWLNRRWTAGTTIAICIAGWAAMQFVEDQYVSTTRVIVDTKTMLSQSLKGIAVEDAEAQVELLSIATSQLLTRDTLNTIIRANDLDLGTDDERELQELRASVLERTTIATDSTNPANRRAPDDIIQISYVSASPEVAYKSVSTYLNILLEKIVGASQEDTESTERFLESKVNQYRRSLERSEAQLKDFKRQHLGLTPGDDTDYFDRIERLQAELRDNQLQLAELENLRTEYSRQIRGLTSSGKRGEDMGLISSPRNDKIAELEARMLDLLLTYTEEHPDVVALRNTIASLKAIGPGSLTDSEQLDVASLSGGRIVEELRVELGKTEALYAGANGRVEEFQRRLEQLQQAVNTIPQIEAEYAQLTRDYATNKTRYDELLDRLQSARLAKERDRSEREGAFNVIEPPLLAIVPAKPNRPLLATGVLLFALIAGIGVGALIELLRPTFADITDFEEEFGFTVLGAVHDASGAVTIRREISRYAAVAGALLAAYVAYVATMIW